MDIKTKNKKDFEGNVIEKRIILNSNTGKISIDEVNKLYKQLITKHKKNKISILGMAPDGHHTLKSFSHIEDDLKFVNEDYYKSFNLEGAAIKEKFSFFFNVEIIIRY
jgi:6-phosphogluconolactonase/glucosamine-6-phosphate isomerase/deaminase